MIHKHRAIHVKNKTQSTQQYTDTDNENATIQKCKNAAIQKYENIRMQQYENKAIQK